MENQTQILTELVNAIYAAADSLDLRGTIEIAHCNEYNARQYEVEFSNGIRNFKMEFNLYEGTFAVIQNGERSVWMEY